MGGWLKMWVRWWLDVGWVFAYKIQIRVMVRLWVWVGRGRLWLLAIWTEDIRDPHVHTKQAKIEGNPPTSRKTQL